MIQTLLSKVKMGSITYQKIALQDIIVNPFLLIPMLKVTFSALLPLLILSKTRYSLSASMLALIPTWSISISEYYWCFYYFHQGFHRRIQGGGGGGRGGTAPPLLENHGAWPPPLNFWQQKKIWKILSIAGNFRVTRDLIGRKHFIPGMYLPGKSAKTWHTQLPRSL